MVGVGLDIWNEQQNDSPSPQKQDSHTMPVRPRVIQAPVQAPMVPPMYRAPPGYNVPVPQGPVAMGPMPMGPMPPPMFIAGIPPPPPIAPMPILKRTLRYINFLLLNCCRFQDVIKSPCSLVSFNQCFGSGSACIRIIGGLLDPDPHG